MPTRVLLPLLTALLAAAPARADFVIDTFTTPNPATTYSLGTAPGSTFTATDALGGGITRTTTVTLLANTLFSSTPANGELGTTGPLSRYSLNTASGATAYTNLNYAFSSPQNFAGAGGEIRFAFSFADQNVPISIVVSDGTTTKTAVQPYTGAGPYSIPLSAFAGVDLSHVASIELVLNQDLNNPASEHGALTSADLTLTSVSVTPAAPSAVPAPPAVLLGLFAVPLLGAARWVRRRAA